MYNRTPIDFENDGSTSPAPRRRGKILILPILIALAVIAFQYMSAEEFVNPETGQAVRVALTSDQENALGLQSMKEILSESRTINSGPELEMVRRVAQRLIQVVDENSQKFEWSVQLIESPEMNAFCLPGGKIAVYTGILPVTQNEDGLAAVMGHEIAHATARHGAQRMLQQNLVNSALMGVNGSVMELDPSQRRVVMGVLGAGVQYGVVLPYGRSHETEADEIGFRYLIRAGYNPQAAIDFWRRMESLNQNQPPEWASTHPSNGSRIARLEELMREHSQS